jgi:2-polyprenyl-3-methyl-5-hydroxy-6-metoxy-1,4-benzoquinol methylase
MDKTNLDLLDKLRRQFDAQPYPTNPIDKSPDEEVLCLYEHNLINAYYKKNRKVIHPEGKVILDAGCGAGYTTLALAQANPGAKVVGVDLSEESIKLARQRLQYHGVEDAECQAMPLEELPKLGREFDYINCDEVLYLLPDPILGLKAMRSVLKPDGIIRANLHSAWQRSPIYRAQEMFKMMGLLEDNPREMEIDIAWETMRALKDNVRLKQQAWNAKFDENKEMTLSNHLLQGDKGYIIPDMFRMLEAADLEWISMVNWRQWNLMDLFKEPADLPVFLAMSLPETTVEERLHLYELLNPIHRLLDFWCGHPHRAQPCAPVAEWTPSDWQNVTVHLHPQLKTATVREALAQCVAQLQPLTISDCLPITKQKHSLDNTMAACLLPPLFDSPQSVASLVQRWQTLRPVHPLTLEATTADEALAALLIPTLTGLENFGYVLLERQS